MKRSREPQNVLASNEIERPDFKRKKTGQNDFVPSAAPIVGIFELNPHVWRNIFAYCTVPDLSVLAASSDQFKALISESGTISGRMFDFKELAKCCHILDLFKMFGQQMTSIKFGEKNVQYKEPTVSNLDKILELISTYCSVDTLKHLGLQYFYGTSIKKRYMYSALPFFQSIESFSLEETIPEGSHGLQFLVDFLYILENRDYNPAINELVERIIGNAKKLTAIQLIRLKVTGRFFFADHILQNLQNLSIVECNIKAPDGIIAYIKAAPKLVSFKWVGSSLFGLDTVTTHSSNIVYELVANNVPDLDIFDYHQNEIFMTEMDQSRLVPNFTSPNIDLIRNFRKLKVLGLKEMDFECLQLLAEMNQIEELDANLELGEVINFDFLTTFTNLKSVKFCILEGEEEIYMNYLQRLPQLTKCYVMTSLPFPALDDVLVKAVETARGLTILKVDHTTGILGIDLYLKLLTARLAHCCLQPMTLQLSWFEMKHFICRLGRAYRPDIIKVQ